MTRRAVLFSILPLRPKTAHLVFTMNRFCDAWNDLVKEMNERGTFNVKKASGINHRFRDVERCEDWPKNAH